MTPDRSPSLLPTIAFEASLGGLGLTVAWLAGLWDPVSWSTIGTPFHAPSLGAVATGIGWGLLGAVPMLGLVELAERLPVQGIHQAQEWVEENVGFLFEGRSTVQLALLALAAGWGEEVLFRWTIQTGFGLILPGPFAMPIGLGVAAIVFGVMHGITWLYAVATGIIGVLLGLELIWTENLVAPITTHAVYDFVLFILLRRRLERRSGDKPTDPTVG